MSNGYFNNQTRDGLKGGKGTRGAERSASSMPTREKPGFNTDLPGKAQSKDRSGGVKHVPKTSGMRKGL